MDAATHRAGLSLDFLRQAAWLNGARVRAYARIFLIVLAIAVPGWLSQSHGLIDPAGHPIGTDFLNVYAAGLMVRDGHAALAYDWKAHGAVEQSVVHYDGYFGWHYPPMFLFVAGLVATLPYLWSLGLYMAVTFAGYLAGMVRLAPGLTGIVWLAAGFPGVFVNLGHGQNGFLTTGLLAAGLAVLRPRPILAGILLGCLAYKPQFALLVPIALLAGGYWRTVAAAALTAGLLAAAATLAFGGAIWTAFAASLEPTRTIILEQGATGWPKIVSVFSAVRLLGGGLGPAYALQSLATLVTVALVALVWWRSPRPGLAAGILVLAVPLTTPYVLDYDLVILAAGVVLLAVEGIDTGFRPWERLLLALVTLAPLLARGIGTAVGVPIVPPILLITLALFSLRLRHEGLPVLPARAKAG